MAAAGRLTLFLVLAQLAGAALGSSAETGIRAMPFSTARLLERYPSDYWVAEEGYAPGSTPAGSVSRTTWPGNSRVVQAVPGPHPSSPATETEPMLSPGSGVCPPFDAYSSTTVGPVLDVPCPMWDPMWDPTLAGDCWRWQSLPGSLISKAYMAGGRECRLATLWVHERDLGWLWDAALGGRVGLLRYGTTRDIDPEGWQLDVEGAAFPRISLERDADLVATDFRVGIPLSVRRGRWEGKLAYYHLSSHLADEYMLTFPAAVRRNYVRDTLVLALAFWPLKDMRLYTEAGYAVNTNGGSEPWEFQFGIDWASSCPTGIRGSPFFAVNARIREEVDFGGNFTCETGWQWRGESGHLARCGMHYFNGHSDQAQFFPDHEEQIGLALWYDY